MFMAMSLVPSLLVRMAYERSKLFTRIRRDGVQVKATARAKRRLCARRGHSPSHSNASRYYVLVTFPISSTDSYETEVEVDAFQFIETTPNLTTFELKYLVDEPCTVALVTFLEGDISTSAIVRGTPGTIIAICIMLMFVVFSIFLSTCNEAAYWSFPIGILLPWIFKCRMGIRSVTNKSGRRIATAIIGTGSYVPVTTGEVTREVRKKDGAAAVVVPISATIPTVHPEVYDRSTVEASAADVNVGTKSILGDDASIADELKKLLELKEAGALTEDEFATLKRDAMNRVGAV